MTQTSLSIAGSVISLQGTLVDLKQARELLFRQDELRASIQTVFAQQEQVAPPSGLYSDEKIEEEDEQFIKFIEYVQKHLALSPRTLLRQAMNTAADEMLPHTLQEELRTLLKLHVPVSTTTPIDTHSLARAIDQITPGQRYLTLQTLLQESASEQQDANSLRKNIEHSLRKHTVQFDQQMLDAAVQRALRKGETRRQKVSEKIVRLQQELETDAEYGVFQRAQHLYSKSGAKALWDNFVTIDRAICQNRGKRGLAFEKHGSSYCFALIVAEFLQQQQQPQPYDCSDFSLQRNIFWWLDGEQVGEIDLAVLCRGKVIAICEMKTSCFEISVAVRQHEAKLDAFAAIDSRYTMGSLVDQPIPIFQGGIPPLLYFATLLPSSSDNNGWMMGVEPLMTRAICDGIRAQGLGLSDATTVELSLPLIPRLLNQPVQIDEAMVYVQSIQVSVNTNRVPKEKSPLNHGQLCAFVKSRMVSHGLSESPQSCLNRYHSRLLVVDPSNWRIDTGEQNDRALSKPLISGT